MKTFKLKQVIQMVSISGLLICFQNCSPVKFDSTEVGQKKPSATCELNTIEDLPVSGTLFHTNPAHVLFSLPPDLNLSDYFVTFDSNSTDLAPAELLLEEAIDFAEIEHTYIAGPVRFTVRFNPKITLQNKTDSSCAKEFSHVVTVRVDVPEISPNACPPLTVSRVVSSLDQTRISQPIQVQLQPNESASVYSKAGFPISLGAYPAQLVCLPDLTYEVQATDPLIQSIKLTSNEALYIFLR